MLAHLNYLNLISIGNVFQAWYEFRKGKRKKKDVQVFERHLEDNLFELHQGLKTKTYRHGNYHSFYVQDPKQRHIHKAEVRDRVAHHLLYKYLYETFDKTFIYDSYSCRLGKGTHKGVKRLEKFTRVVSKNYTQSCWALKLDIKKFFASVDHTILLKLLKRKIVDLDIIWLLSEVLNSFYSKQGIGRGIPLGNLTSQVFANIYMNELDQFIKHTLRVKNYLRYADDLVMLSADKDTLQRSIVPIAKFLENILKVKLHPKKIIFRRLDWGIDFLGYIILPHYRLPRTKTKRRIFKKVRYKIAELRSGEITKPSFKQTATSYLGFLKHANAYKLTQQMKHDIWFWT